MPDQRPQPPTRPRKWTRTAAIALLLLAGGAVVNVAVAWGCAVLIAHPQGSGPLEPSTAYFLGVESIESPGWYTMGWRGFGSLQLLSEPTGPDHFATEKTFLEVFGAGEQFVAPRWSRVNSASSELAIASVEDARGWPMLALRCEHEMNRFSSNVKRTRCGIGLASNPLGNGLFGWLSPRAIPLCPISTGFIVNTLFYALLLWLLFFAPFAARRLLRRRRALCEACAYPIGDGPVCTECGAAVRQDEPRA